MSQKKCKLVLKTITLLNEVDHLCAIQRGDKIEKHFRIVKSVNTVEFGIPGDVLNRAEVDRILIDHGAKITRNTLTVEFIN